jgi:SAM-dependent MidA family methyltransferase
MVYSTEFGLYQALEQVLRQAEKPMTCNELFDLPSVKQYAAPNEEFVSDFATMSFSNPRPS